MANKIKKIFKDSSSNGYVMKSTLTDYGSMFGLTSGDLQPNEGFANGFGLFEFGSSKSEINPSNSTLEDTYLEYDGNGDLMPKE